MSHGEPMKDAMEGDEVAQVACSICLDTVKTGGDRSTAKLQCGHGFHLDCIGSAFNAKGSMQCPNCRKVEEGNWLYANGSRPTPEFTMDEWTLEEDLYNYPETPFECFWSPFGGSLARIPSLFEDGESSPAVTFRDLLGHPAIFTEHQATASATHLCPLLAYTRVLQPLSSNSHSIEARIDGPGYHHQWSHFHRARDIHIPHMMAPSNLHYRGWEHHLSYPLPDAHIGNADPASHFARLDSDGLVTADSVLHPFVRNHGLGPRAGATSSSMPTLVAAPYHRNNGIAHEHYQLQNPQSAHGAGMTPQPLPHSNLRSFNPSGQCGPFLIPPAMSGQPTVDIESNHRCWGPFLQASGAPPDPHPPPAFLPFNASERPPVQAAAYNSRSAPPVRMLSLM